MKSMQNTKVQHCSTTNNPESLHQLTGKQQLFTESQFKNNLHRAHNSAQGSSPPSNNSAASPPHISGSGNTLVPTAAGRKQSLSGSETDLSTSNENLTHEEKYVLHNSTRQEPQGEETLEVEVAGHHRYTSHHSNYTSMDQSSCNTLIIHRDADTDFDDEDDEDEDDCPRYYNHNARVRGHYACSETNNTGQQPQQSDGELLTTSVTTASAAGKQLPFYRHAPLFSQHMTTQKQYADRAELMSTEAQSLMTVHQVPSNVVSSAPVSTTQRYPTSIKGLSAACSCDGKIDLDMSKLPPPPAYPEWLQTELTASEMALSTTTTSMLTQTGCVNTSTSGEHIFPIVSQNVTFAVGTMSRSQPDLSCLGHWDEVGGFRRNPHYLSQRPRTKGKASPEVSPAMLHQRAYDIRYQANADFGHRDSRTDKLIEILMLENRQLKCELDSSYHKVLKLQKFEAEIQKVHQAHEDLVKLSQKREELEQKVKMKLHLELRRHQELNKELRAQLDVANTQLAICQPLSVGDSIESKRDMLHRDTFITQLIQQNKELIASKERYEIELAAQRATLQEQRTHIDILDSALTNAQANVVKLEEECRKKQAYVDRVGQLQKAFTSLQVASERRDQMAKTLRCQLEKELQELKHQLRQQQQEQLDATARKQGKKISDVNSACGRETLPGGSVLTDNETIDNLKLLAREKDEKIIALENEVYKWEQRYLEENTMRQIAIDAASMPKDAKIAALEHTSEKLIAQARSEKLRHMDELHIANKQCADVDAKVKDLESRLAERDAMIKVLQKHSIEKDAAYQNAILRSPRHTPHPSLHNVISSSRGNSLSRGSSSSPQLTCSQEETPTASGALKSSVSVSKESLDEQLKKLDSQLLSKDSIIQALRSEKEKYPSHYWMV